MYRVKVQDKRKRENDNDEEENTNTSTSIESIVSSMSTLDVITHLLSTCVKRIVHSTTVSIIRLQKQSIDSSNPILFNILAPISTQISAYSMLLVQHMQKSEADQVKAISVVVPLLRKVKSYLDIASEMNTKDLSSVQKMLKNGVDVIRDQAHEFIDQLPTNELENYLESVKAIQAFHSIVESSNIYSICETENTEPEKVAKILG